MAITFTPGQTVSGPDWEELFSQHGGAKSTTKRPPTKEEQRAADDAGDDLDQNPIYRYYAEDGSYVEARVAPNGDYQIVDYKPSAKFTQAQKQEEKPAAPTQKPTGGSRNIEGTPDPSKPGGFDNERPRWVTRDQQGNEVWSEPVTGKDLDDWRASRERSRNSGKTDAEIAAEKPKEIREPVPDRPGYTAVKKTDPATGLTETYYLDPSGNRVNALPEKPQTAKPEKDANGNWGYWDTKPGQSPKWVPIAGGPNATASPTPVQINGVYGVWKPGQNGAAPTFEPIASQPGRAALPPDAPQFDNSSAEAAFRSYQELYRYVDQKVRSGEWTAEQGKSILAGPHEMTGQLLDRQKEERQANEGLRRDQLTERSQDMTQTGNRLNFSQGAAQTAIRTSGDLIKAAEGGESTIVPLMVLQAGMGQAMGGFREAPAVTRGTGMLPAVAQRAGAGFVSPAGPETVGRPNQLGVGAIGDQPAPGGLPSPLLPPRPMADAPAATGGPPVRDDYRTNPGEAPEALMPKQMLRSAMGTRTADDLERELLAEGWSPEEVRRARMRAQQRAGITAVA